MGERKDTTKVHPWERKGTTEKYCTGEGVYNGELPCEKKEDTKKKKKLTLWKEGRSNEELPCAR